MRKYIPLAGLVLTILVTGSSDAKDTPKAEPTLSASVQGENVCLGCALKKDFGAPSQCAVYGHKHALKVESVTRADGKAVKGWKGRTLQYLENDRSKTLVSGEAGNGRMEVMGTIYTGSQVVAVESFKSLGEGMESKEHEHIEH
ncbi:MAG: hypothetical protein FJY67_03170 [Calditrichaeota bacterium]|nr:hypothetical protein [Calditrichota bacterium]